MSAACRTVAVSSLAGSAVAGISLAVEARLERDGRFTFAASSVAGTGSLSLSAILASFAYDDPRSFRPRSDHAPRLKFHRNYGAVGAETNIASCKRFKIRAPPLPGSAGMKGMTEVLPFQSWT
jgi:hypothetical protein